MEDDEDLPDFMAEDCEECGCEAGEFEDSDWYGGTWHCPECGAVQ